MDHRVAPVTPTGHSRTARLALAAACCAVAATGLLAAPGCGSRPDYASFGSVASASPATTAVVSSPTPASPTATGPAAASAESRVVAAAAVVRRFCRLVDQHRYATARRLFTGPSVWPLRELQAVHRLRFVSAQAWGEPADAEATLLVTFTATVGWRSPLTDGLNDVFFTLTRRVTAGEWLIAAVSTSP